MAIEQSLFAFIWTHSKKAQLGLLAVTAALFPLLYLTLELPKRIINDAIGASGTPTEIAGVQFGQVTLLAILCTAFLLAVIAHGLLKMRINTMKGVVAERLLRRFRYALIGRIIRFPRPYFQRTSQGELVSMVTSEAEPLGGMMGDALAQPVLQAGQMLTILGFLFIQSLWFGLAAMALIPVQAWAIPRLQRRINVLNKARVQQVRRLASQIGETAAGADTLRRNGGWRNRMAIISARLGRLFEIRLAIYRKKFFMKFLNNFLTQITPFMFFSIGGYLVIRGNVSLGALVAALAAYKDLSSPWKELLTYYTQAQEMSQRWSIITERFAPRGMIDETLFDDPDTAADAATDEALTGDIVLENVSVHDANGAAVLKDLSLRLPGGRSIGIAAPSAEDRRALAELVTREITPTEGTLKLGERPMNSIRQSVIAARIGYVDSRPFVFQGSFGDNVLMPLKSKPATPAPAPFAREAALSGNSIDPVAASWLDPARGDLATQEAVRARWLALIEEIGSAEALFNRGLDLSFNAERHPDLAARLVALRPKLLSLLREEGLTDQMMRFDVTQYAPALPVMDNLLFAVPRSKSTLAALTGQEGFQDLLRQLGLHDTMLSLSRDVMNMLRQTFGMDGTDHPLFRKLGLEPALYEMLVELSQRPVANGSSRRRTPDLGLLMSVPFRISAQQIGPAFSDEIKQRILTLRAAHAEDLQARLIDEYVPLDPDEFAPGLTVLENAMFGKAADTVGTRADRMRGLIAQTLRESGLAPAVTALIYDLPTELGGANLPSVFAEALSLSRAAIKAPDILVLDTALATHDADVRRSAHSRLRRLLPDATILVLEPQIDDIDAFDAYVEIEQGRVVDSDIVQSDDHDNAASADLARKLQALEKTQLFSGLDRKQLRLLAFGARWYTAKAGDVIFHKGDDAADGAYLLLEGAAALYRPGPRGAQVEVAKVAPGTVVGELGLITDEPRRLAFRANSDLTILRIGASEFLAVVENDAATALKLLRVAAGYLSDRSARRQERTDTAPAPQTPPPPGHATDRAPASHDSE
ncbi:ABC transporter transmembrane domain-containing protein [Sulfitobacter sabulilitoris]|uniref:Cyclic nucleotide-binding domain-containing protein n=1 Tax=Sulfitobacter sabulilitoris TaxID=2562655 RepID=A0A5S3PF75_9RHOB|nr:ABC transporter transmembrane domain-containing protein [Sulfitobacter sabulilitoris]TMM51770.1 cyclic nucleotide-binding domain-containing protein [Sulfitobacter sabulilitoris]